MGDFPVIIKYQPARDKKTKHIVIPDYVNQLFGKRVTDLNPDSKLDAKITDFDVRIYLLLIQDMQNNIAFKKARVSLLNAHCLADQTGKQLNTVRKAIRTLIAAKLIEPRYHNTGREQMGDKLSSHLTHFIFRSKRGPWFFEPWRCWEYYYNDSERVFYICEFKKYSKVKLRKHGE